MSKEDTSGRDEGIFIGAIIAAIGVQLVVLGSGHTVTFAIGMGFITFPFFGAIFDKWF